MTERHEVTPPEVKTVTMNKTLDREMFKAAGVAGADKEKKAFLEKHKING